MPPSSRRGLYWTDGQGGRYGVVIGRVRSTGCPCPYLVIVLYIASYQDGVIDMTEAKPNAVKRRRAPSRKAIGRSQNGSFSQAVAASGFVTRFMNEGGVVDVDRVADVFRMSKSQLAQTAGLGMATVSKADRRAGPKAQTRVTEILEIISRVREWAGGEAQAMAWYRSQPIPALDGRTPEALVKAGRATAVREYLDHVALGGFA